MDRLCNVCGSSFSTKLFDQVYFLPDNKINTHSILSCKNCGFIYANGVLNQQMLDSYYKNNKKYVNKLYYNQKSNSIAAYHIQSFKRLYKYLNTIKLPNLLSLKILDIGCAAGNFLSVFKQHGFTHLTGIDPSIPVNYRIPNNSETTFKSASLDKYQTRVKFDIISLYAVLEHINKLDNSFNKITQLLTKDGYLFLSLPYTAKFSQKIIEPYMEFSLEHINFFTKQTLINLCGKYGFHNEYFYIHTTDKYGSIALDSVWKFDGIIRPQKFDNVGINTLKKYISLSERKLNKIKAKIDNLVMQNKEIIVWGVGSLTSRLLATTKLKHLNIHCFIDINSTFHKQTIVNKSIHGPNYIINHRLPVLVASFLRKEEIIEILHTKYKYKDSEIITL
jgi:2-polyprenyl-3-methyl-5-hydroxy-6-metoxy-1,4-benzoquinol methylase